jgi:hypothetical protein
MINSIGKHYLYRHIRLDTKEPFYIGIGTKRNCKNFKPVYERAFEVKRRGSFWKNVVSKTDYEVEILLESDDYEFIKQKEIEFIALYKRKDCCNGTLVNLTDGGDGFLGRHTNETKQKMIKTKALKKDTVILSITDKVISLYSKGVIITEISKIVKANKDIIKSILKKEGVLKNSSDYKKVCFYVYNFKNGSVTYYYCKYNELSKIFKINEGCIRNHCYKKNNITDCGYLILQKEVPFEEAKLEYNNRVLNKCKVEKEQRKTYQKYNKIVQKDLNGEVIKIWDRMQDIINELGLKNSTPILRVIKNQRKHFRKFIWERL